MPTTLIKLLVAGLFLCSARICIAEVPQTPRVSVTTLIANQKMYHTKRVRVAGYAVFAGARASYIYDSAEAAERGISGSSICLSYDRNAWEQIKEFKSGWVEVYGAFEEVPKNAISTNGGVPTFVLPSAFDISPLVPHRDEVRAKLAAATARVEIMLQILSGEEKIPTKEELEKLLKQADLNLRRYDLTGKRPSE